MIRYSIILTWQDVTGVPFSEATVLVLLLRVVYIQLTSSHHDQFHVHEFRTLVIGQALEVYH